MHPRIRSQAACDTCRLRKTRCVKKNNEELCVLCSFHGLRCTFERGPARKPRQRRRPPDRAGHISEAHEQPAKTRDAEDAAPQSPDSVRTSYSYEEDEVRVSTCPAGAYPSILNDTLGLDPVNNAEYIGSSDYRDPILLDLRSPHPASANFVRRMDDRTLFVVHPDTSEDRRTSDLDAIEAAVQPMGHRLVRLYFQFVHPSFPILHKDVFIAKHQTSHRQFAPSLLAAVYLLALDWQIHDSVLENWSAKQTVDVALLERMANVALQEEMHSPKLSTLEAGLLLLQRSRLDSSGRPASSVWKLHAQLVAISYDLGLHVNCESWSIPVWEAGLRRRLSWALYMQDRWTAFVHGRPMLLSEDDWDLSPCSSSDFPEHDKSEGLGLGAVAAHIGWQLFLSHIELSQILDDVNRTYYVATAQRRDGTLDKMGVLAAVDLAQPILRRLSQWKTSLPDVLAFSPTRDRSVCASASLHLAYHTVVVLLYRALVRILTPQAPPSLHTAVRSAARKNLEAAIHLLMSLGPEHTAAFWGGVASYQVGMIGSFAGLLWATAEDGEEMTWCVMRVDDLKWALQIRGSAAPFARKALQLLESEVGSLVKPNPES
ncbi:uncharacterized protein CC84DRAFT_1198636 [Paraphaeosphaeria sporulosa]|uniref:Zn(2)-C6 fungal-type domain-containing protein n=1 Tax=Paraphaeosphaeria sporulosa TaxID=1460663 RepID=A0A177C3M9_9PLEO|nr:uncharacterized protein CC84DRAFT_1198636 [Paraphaeosphaeria sporulosa]OAG01387.1 hypothetical protein CC84DRAFT_1198636 [Paraphaeosphaeria sporulosa]